MNFGAATVLKILERQIAFTVPSLLKRPAVLS